MKRTTLVLLALALTTLPPTHARDAARQATGNAIVAAANPLAANAGAEILRRGGNAIDAAVAVQAMLGLVEPQSSGLGGGSFLLYYDAATGRVSAFNGRETAPAGATSGMFLDEAGKPLPQRRAVLSGRSIGVPGTVAMLAAAHAQLGVLPWKSLFEPAHRAAINGFEVPQRLGRFMQFAQSADMKEVLALFARPDGSPLQAGDTFRNPAYARTLEKLGADGARALYEGEIAAQIVARVHEEPLAGSMQPEDLAAYQPERTDALCNAYRQYRVCVPPPPSSGVSLLQALAILDQTDIAKRGPRDARAWLQFGEASRLMYADRDQYVADPRFVPVPVARLLEPSYVRDRAQLIGERAAQAVQPGMIANLRRPIDATQEIPGTSHFVIADAHGNVVSMTTTVESVFGSGRTVGGFVLNNQLTDFSLQPEIDGRPVANAVAGGKRPRSSMAPVIVLDRKGRFVAAVGSPGGSAILAYNAKALVGVLAWNLPMQSAIELPNVVARGTQYQAEVDRLAPETLDALRALGADVQAGRAENSGFHGIVRKPDGSYEGGADPRREGIVVQVPRAQQPDAASLSGLRIEVPCADHFNEGTECHWSRELLQPAGSPWKLDRELVRKFAADPAKVYDVTLRVRGVVEPKNFTGGEIQFDHFQSGGTPVKNDYNFYNLEISDPRAVFTVNRSAQTVGHFTFPIDYRVTVPIRGGATVTMGAFDSNDVAIANHQRHVVAGVPPDPQPFDGQFFQIDVEEIHVRR